MVSFICPRCQKQLILPDHIQDFVHDCSENLEASSTLRYDDVLVIGGWNDWTGSKFVPGTVTMNNGRTNDIKSQRAKIEGAYKPVLTVRGNKKSITREREHLEYIDLKNKEKKSN